MVRSDVAPLGLARCNVAVVGLGAVGSAATYHLAHMGASVIGIDQFSPPHKFGSSHGDSRITRAAIGEGVEYCELALRSHALWRDIEAQTKMQLFERCGCLTISGPNAVVMHDVDDFFANIAIAARRFSIPHRTYPTPEAIRAAFPQFGVADGDQAILDEEAGYLVPETCILAQLTLAERAGAQIRRNSKVARIEPKRDGVDVEMVDGSKVMADRVLVAAGAWLPGFVQTEIARHLTVTRQVLHWFEIKRNPERYKPANCPVFIWQLPLSGDIKSSIYGFPLTGDAGAGIKVSHEESGGITSPDRVNRTVTEDDSARVYQTYIAPFFPDLGPRCLRTETCLYTRVDRSRFIIDQDPRHARVSFVSACSGHGFKHSAALGEAMAQQLTNGRATHIDLEPFRLKRLPSYLRSH